MTSKIDKIPFNKAYFAVNQLKYVENSFQSDKISGNGVYTKKCIEYFKDKFGFSSLLTSSCTDALELIADLLNLEPGDEIIVPSYTFVSSALPFAKKRCVLKFCDSLDSHPNIDLNKAIELITDKTRAIILVHYAGISCDMRLIEKIRGKGIVVIEDAAQCIDSYYFDTELKIKRPLGSFGNFSSFSFHETKNISAGEGGLAVINDLSLYQRAEILLEKGTNRLEFFRGEIDKYGWVDIGSSYLPSDYTAAILYAQLEELSCITAKRKLLYNRYYDNLSSLNNRVLKLPIIPDYGILHNAHIFYILLENVEQRDMLIKELRSFNIFPAFHYISLHKSKFNLGYSKNIETLKNSDYFSDCLLRLPMYFDLTESQVDYICEKIHLIFK